MGKERIYIAIDLKSFYASVECVERGLDALDTCLVVADASRTDKTICLAVSPALKVYGTGPRPRLFEVNQKIGEANRKRGNRGKSVSGAELASHPELAIDFIVATPRMALYLDYSRRIYEIYLQYIAPEDIYVYSVDEVFMDITDYVTFYGLSPHNLAKEIIQKVIKTTGITATVGIGTNMYLCKVAMDIVAKKMKADKDGVRIAELDERSYREQLWSHEPITDFWRVGRGTMSRLLSLGLRTMGDVARCSLTHEHLLYELFGINAELLIDHAWGWEPVTMEFVKSYEPETHSISSGQVLNRPYSVFEARNVMLEMIDNVALELVEKHLATDQVTLTIGYDSLKTVNPEYEGGPIKTDRFGRKVPRHAHGTANIDFPTSSCDILLSKFTDLFDRIVNPLLMVRRITITTNRLLKTNDVIGPRLPAQMSLFDSYEDIKRDRETTIKKLKQERCRQEAILNIKNRFGKNAILRGFNYADGATQRERNMQIGGHKA